MAQHSQSCSMNKCVCVCVCLCVCAGLSVKSCGRVYVCEFFQLFINSRFRVQLDVFFLFKHAGGFVCFSEVHWFFPTNDAAV